MYWQAHTVTTMPPSSPLVKLPLLPRGLLSYLPASILPSGRDESTATPTTDTPSTPPSSEKMSSPGEQQQAGSGNGSSKASDSAELASVFELFDKNGDGRITREELEESLSKLGMSVGGDELASMMARIDANGDGCVDVEEFGELYRAITAAADKDDSVGREEDADDNDDMREAFRVFDANGDGYITVDELGAVLSSLGLKPGRTAEECRRMIGRVDRDGDGRVDFHEFRQMMRAGGLAATLG